MILKKNDLKRPPKIQQLDIASFVAIEDLTHHSSNSSSENCKNAVRAMNTRVVRFYEKLETFSTRYQEEKCIKDFRNLAFSA
jgi:hypothetical protein